jgi:Ca2+-binding EF-hand superfamily protein
MKRSIISLLLVGVCAGTATAALAQNVTAGDPGKPSQVAPTDQKEMTSPNAQAVNPTKGKHDQGAAAFTKADKDHDGTLDQKEAKAMPDVAKNFEAIDTDKDGTVSLKEVHNFMKAQHEASTKN